MRTKLYNTLKVKKIQPATVCILLCPIKTPGTTHLLPHCLQQPKLTYGISYDPYLAQYVARQVRSKPQHATWAKVLKI